MFKLWARPVLGMCTELNDVLQKSCQPRTSEWDLIWKQGLCRCNQVKTGLHWIRVGPNQWLLNLEERNLDRDIEKRMSCENRDTQWQRQKFECPIYNTRNPKDSWKLTEARRGEERLYLRALSKSVMLQHLEFEHFFKQRAWSGTPVN